MHYSALSKFHANNHRPILIELHLFKVILIGTGTYYSRVLFDGGRTGHSIVNIQGSIEEWSLIIAKFVIYYINFSVSHFIAITLYYTLRAHIQYNFQMRKHLHQALTDGVCIMSFWERYSYVESYQIKDKGPSFS